MSTTEPSKIESMTSESNLPPLDVRAMTKPILHNYDMHVNNFILFLRDRLQIHLVYVGPTDIYQHILKRTMYTCSLHITPKKILKNLFPIMIGSRLDYAIRHEGKDSFQEPFDLEDDASATFPFQTLDIARGFFLINGLIRQLPYFYTNDPTNTHVIQRKSVRVYAYSGQDRGKELNYYLDETREDDYGKVVIVDTDGKTTSSYPNFFSHCPYPVDFKPYLNHVFQEEDPFKFDIDHLGNKMVVSPGHMFTKLIIKYLYGPLRDGDTSLIKSRAALISNSIENGYLLHVLSRKTVYFKESRSAGKMTHTPKESHREIGTNGEVFMEKNMGCYREVLTQTYPLNPFLLYMIVRQTSKKVRHSSIDSFHPSYQNFLCILGIFETKNVGRTTMMVRNTIVTACNDLDSVFHENPDETFWSRLRLEPEADSPYYVVVNEACIPVSYACFHQIDLLKLKMTFRTVECYVRGKFIVIRYKMGIIMKQIPSALPIWTSPYDEAYWLDRMMGLDPKPFFGYDFITSFLVDLNPNFLHNSFPKNMLAFNALKGSVCPRNPRVFLYFMDPMSAFYTEPHPDHILVMRPVDDLSRNFELKMPGPVTVYMSHIGLAQEDCILKAADYKGFDCVRAHTIRCRIDLSRRTAWMKFYPVKGEENTKSNLVGTLVGGEPFNVEPFSIHVRVEQVSSQEYRIYFAKKPFRVLQYHVVENELIVCVGEEHIASTGDKLCSLHGQKGVIRVIDKVPLLDKHIRPDLIINPYCMFRMTPGQIKESLFRGGCKDATCVQNAQGRIIPNGKALYGKVLYFPVAYWAKEHLYAPEKCVLDRVLSQPVKGRSRGGGMKLGNMELNALRGNGIAACFEEKFFEDGDRVPQESFPTLALPKSVNLVTEDAKFFKSHLQYHSTPSIFIEED